MGIEGQLRQFADRVQDDEQVSGLLEGLRKVIFDYQVCSCHSNCTLVGADKRNRWYTKRRCTNNSANK